MTPSVHPPPNYEFLLNLNQHDLCLHPQSLAEGRATWQATKGQLSPIHSFHRKKRKCSNATLGNELSLGWLIESLFQNGPGSTSPLSHTSYTHLYTSHSLHTHSHSLHIYTRSPWIHTPLHTHNPSFTHTHHKYIFTCTLHMRARYTPHTLHTYLHIPLTDVPSKQSQTHLRHHP